MLKQPKPQKAQHTPHHCQARMLELCLAETKRCFHVPTNCRVAPRPSRAGSREGRRTSAGENLTTGGGKQVELTMTSGRALTHEFQIKVCHGFSQALFKFRGSKPVSPGACCPLLNLGCQKNLGVSILKLKFLEITHFFWWTCGNCFQETARRNRPPTRPLLQRSPRTWSKDISKERSKFKSWHFLDSAIFWCNEDGWRWMKIDEDYSINRVDSLGSHFLNVLGVVETTADLLAVRGDWVGTSITGIIRWNWLDIARLPNFANKP